MKTRRAFLVIAGAAAAATAFPALPADAEADPAVIIGRQYFEALARYRAADDARDQREGEARRHHPKPPRELMVQGWPSTDSELHLVLPDLIDYHFVGAKARAAAQRLWVKHAAACAGVDARFGLPEMRAECDRLRNIEGEIWERLVATPATTIEGLALKLRAVQAWGIDDENAEAMVNGAVNDAERQAGLPLSPPVES